jgi:hypothetical protein
MVRIRLVASDKGPALFGIVVLDCVFLLVLTGLALDEALCIFEVSIDGLDRRLNTSFLHELLVSSSLQVDEMEDLHFESAHQGLEP